MVVQQGGPTGGPTGWSNSGPTWVVQRWSNGGPTVVQHGASCTFASRPRCAGMLVCARLQATAILSLTCVLSGSIAFAVCCAHLCP
eukprot:4098174-Alexandrium_andersonii.AAC.1